MEWILQRLPSGRVMIDGVLAPGADIIDYLPAATWLEASASVSVLAFEHVPGYGYFARA